MRGPRGRGRPAKVFALTDAARERFGRTPTTTSPPPRCAGSPSTAARTRWPRSPPTQVAGAGGALPGRDAPRPATTRSPGREALAERADRRGLRCQRVRRSPPAGSCASTTARWRTWPPSSRSCARPRPQVISRLVGTHVQRLATIAHGDGVCTTHIPAPTRAAGRHRTDREDRQMTEQIVSPTQDEQLAALGKYEYGWADSDAAGATARRGLNEDVVRDISAKKNEPEWMLDLRLKGLRLFGRKPMPAWGADLSGIDFDNIKYFVRSTEKQAASWEDLPEDIKNTYDRLGIPEAEKQRLVAGVAAQYESEVVYHKIREDLEEQGVIFLDTDTGAARARGALQGVLRHGDPGRRQQVRRAEHRRVVRRLVHLRAEGRARRDPAAGLLPDQHREHGPVRADADHRRRGRLRALRRGLHRADLLVRLAALRGRRDHREEERPLPVHDHPELVEQRLQPGHQARRGARGRDHGVDRRQHRLQGDHEVPGRLHDRRARQGRGALGRHGRRGPAPGRRRQDGARRAAHLLDDHLASRSPAAAAAPRYRGLVQVLEGSHHSRSRR